MNSDRIFSELLHIDKPQCWEIFDISEYRDSGIDDDWFDIEDDLIRESSVEELGSDISPSCDDRFRLSDRFEVCESLFWTRDDLVWCFYGFM